MDLKVLSATEGSIPIAIELGSQHYAPVISSQGHIVGLTEMDTGKLADKSFLTMFGDDLALNPLCPWRFCGKRHETSDLGLIDFGYRFYHPKSAQWLTQDPLGETDGPNLYAYVNNSPTCRVDRFGLFMDDFDFSTSWSNLKNNCSWVGSQIADNTINSPRFTGALQCATGTTQLMSGSLLTGVGAVETVTGIGAPVGMPTALGGMALIAYGMDNMSTGFHQCCTGRFQDSTTVQLLKSTGMSDESVLVTDYALAMVSGKLAYSGRKMASSAALQLGSQSKTETFVNRGASLAGSKNIPLDYAPYQRFRNQEAIISGRRYSGHALDRMQDRGLMPSVVENTINTGQESSKGTILRYYDTVNEITVIVGEGGQIITVFPGG